MQDHQTWFDVKARTIFKVIGGSHAYGMATSESDIDYRGIAIPPKNIVFGFASEFDQAESKPDPNYPEKEDSVIYNIRKFFKLAVANNPNILEFLWMPEDCIILTTPWMEKIIEHRDKFLCTRVKHAYSGYAMAQLKRIKSHRGWLLNPVKTQPKRSDFGLPDNQDLTELKKSIEMINKSGLDAMQLFGEQIQKEASYKQALKNWRSYQNWKKFRNPKRAELEAKHGYDTKHAAHLIRLMRQGYEMMTTGEVHVRRPDAEELLAIRNKGIWSYDKLIEFAEAMDTKLDTYYKSGECKLPKTPDINFLNDLCTATVEGYLAQHG